MLRDLDYGIGFGFENWGFRKPGVLLLGGTCKKDYHILGSAIYGKYHLSFGLHYDHRCSASD